MQAGVLGYYEVSAKARVNVEGLFVEGVRAIRKIRHARENVTKERSKVAALLPWNWTSKYLVSFGVDIIIIVCSSPCSMFVEFNISSFFLFVFLHRASSSKSKQVPLTAEEEKEIAAFRLPPPTLHKRPVDCSFSFHSFIHSSSSSLLVY